MNKKIKAPIVDALIKYSNNPSVSLHIPANAKGCAVWKDFESIVGNNIIKLDTTDEFDKLGTLHPASGPIKEAQELAAKAFGAKESFFLVNGSTVGNLALALTVARENKKIILSRNSHRSIISGLTITGSIPVWAIPETISDWGLWGEIKPETIEHLINKNPDIEAVWLTSPTYEGICSDIGAISKICKKNNVIFIVDEAHGSLWQFNDKLPISALALGADAVVHSLHKHGGSFAQSSILHLGKNSKINRNQLEANLKMLHTTSPSYLLLASIDAARAFLESSTGIKKIESTVKNAINIKKELTNINNIECLDVPNMDCTKIYLRVKNYSGKQLAEILENKYNISIESALDEGILILSNIGNDLSELTYFCNSIKEIAKSKMFVDIIATPRMPFYIPKMSCTPRVAFISEKEKIKPSHAINRISAEVIAVCPPGIPVLVPGEKITEKHLNFLDEFENIWVIK